MEEFSHTILHGENIAKVLTPARPAPSRPPSVPLGRPIQSPMIPSASPNQKPYDPSKIYKNPLPVKRPQIAVQKSQEKKVVSSFEKKKNLMKPQLEKNIVRLFFKFDCSIKIKFIIKKRPLPEQKKRFQDNKEDISQPKKQLENFMERQKVKKFK